MLPPVGACLYNRNVDIMARGGAWRASSYGTRSRKSSGDQDGSPTSSFSTPAVTDALYEVLTALAGSHSITLNMVIAAAQSKREERGGFGMRLWLETAETESK